VGVLAKRRTQRLAETERVAMHLTLVDQRLLAFVHELDRILDRDNVIRLVLVQVVDHAGERRRLAGARRTGDENESARMHRDVLEDAGRTEIVERENLRRDRAEDRGASSVLIERVHAEARELRDLERKVRLEELFEILPLFVVHDVIHHTVHFLVLQRWHIDSLYVAVDADDRGDSSRQVQIGCVVLDRKGEQLGDIYGSH